MYKTSRPPARPDKASQPAPRGDSSRAVAGSSASPLWPQGDTLHRRHIDKHAADRRGIVDDRGRAEDGRAHNNRQFEMRLGPGLDGVSAKPRMVAIGPSGALRGRGAGGRGGSVKRSVMLFNSMVDSAALRVESATRIQA
jgi:hypothetical protein